MSKTSAGLSKMTFGKIFREVAFDKSIQSVDGLIGYDIPRSVFEKSNQSTKDQTADTRKEK